LTPLDKARWLGLLVPAALLAGALGSQYIGGLHPCQMCHWQRWGHYAALGLTVLSFAFRGGRSDGRPFVWLAMLGILSSGLVGVFHAGVEADLWEGLTRCTSGVGSGSTQDILADIMATPLVRCDDIQWSFLGISMAGWNAIWSIGFAMVMTWLLTRRSPARA
jgi:disulfide bond formation protein DsbB